MTENLLIEKRFQNISDNLDFIRANISSAAKKAGKAAADIKLMAVTKTVEPIFINKAIECGVDLIGENKVQELLSKREHLNLDGVDCHIIGHLQTNKVRQIVGIVSTVQSLDSVRLAAELSKRSKAANVVTDCLIEVNIGEEESKTGILFDDVFPAVEEFSEMEGIHIKGLMAIPPVCESDELKKYFEKMHRLFIDIKAQKCDNVSMEILSMGMSGDYMTAIEHGSNMVRIGSSIFGPRLY